MKPIAKSLAALGVATTMCLQSAIALAQGGPPPQILPKAFAADLKSCRSRESRSASTCSKRPVKNSLYSVFVSSKVKKDQKAPLIIALRGFTGTTLTFVRGTAVDLAEDGGYILVGAIGYNNRAGFGVQAGPRPGAAPGAPRPPPQSRAQQPLRLPRHAHSLHWSAAPKRPIPPRSPSTAKRT